MRKIFLITGLVLSVCALCCVSSAEEKALRIISLAPSTTEILFSLGLEDEIVGVTTFCNYPPGAQQKERVGTFSQPDMERIVYLEPDIIFATSLEQAPVVEKLRTLNMKVTVSDPSTIEELFGSIEGIGELTGRRKKADSVVRHMKSRIGKVASAVKKVPMAERPKVFIEVWHDPLMSAGRGSFVDELIDIAGGVNIAHDSPRPYSYFSAEQVIMRDPDYIILGYMSRQRPVDFLKARMGWGEISAVRDNRVYNDINSDLFLRPGPRLVEGLEQIHRKLYPK